MSADEIAMPAPAGPFAVSLDIFSGPFSVLLSLIAKRRLDVTEVALAEVTDEFIGFIQAQSEYDLSQASEFLVVAATLLDLKAARLLPGTKEDQEEIELLEQRDLLFAKLLQYRAYKQASLAIADRLSEAGRAYARDVPLEERYVGLLPDVHLDILPEEFALVAYQAFARDQSEPEVQIAHLHNPLVSVASQVDYLREMLATGGAASFAELCADAPDRQTVVSRFMAVLELVRRREARVAQDEALGTISLELEAGDG
ncbi:segregation/condensation protein A [Actinomycetaceae bacterium L2_0104]